MRRPVKTPSPDIDGEKSLCRICNGRIINFSPFKNSTKVAHCTFCGTETITPLPTGADIEHYYSSYSTTKTAERQVEYLTALAIDGLKFYINNMNIADRAPDSVRFVELGFGNGAGMFAGSKLGYQSYGIDLDAESVSRARSFATKHALNLTCARGDIKALRDFDVEFDIVKASQILEHVLDPFDFLSEIAKVQMSGGYLIIECPNNNAAFWFFKNRVRKVFDRLNFYNSLKLQEHLWGYTKKSLPLLMQKVGYSVVFLRDYAVGDAIYQPETVLWYPTLREASRHFIAGKTWRAFLYPSVRVFDQLASRFFGMGTGLAALFQKTAP